MVGGTWTLVVADMVGVIVMVTVVVVVVVVEGAVMVVVVEVDLEVLSVCQESSDVGMS